MKFYKAVIFIFLATFFVSCEEEIKNVNDYFSIDIKEDKTVFTPLESLTVTLVNKKNVEIRNTVFLLDGTEIGTGTIPLAKQRMGRHTIEAHVDIDGTIHSVTKDFLVVADKKPEIYGYQILETYHHDPKAYTQGLEFNKDTLYESTGQYQQSTLRKTNYTTGEVLQQIAIGDQYFGEGLTVIDDKIFQLTWRSGNGFIYNKNTFKRTGTFVYGKSKEGWGLCNDGENIYKSDGTEKIWTLDKETLAEQKFIEVYTNKSKIDTINELEWVDNKIYANIYRKDAIAIVNPISGAVEAVINLKGLKDNVSQTDELDVLNGIAYKGEPNILYVTGKNWNKLFKIEVLKN